MTRIDPARISEIFRSLNSTSSKQTKKTLPINPHKPIDAQNKSDPERNKAFLKENLQRRLSRLKSESKNFEKDAPVVTIREVLLWEFGESILTHSDFKLIVGSVTDTILNNSMLEKHIQELISTLTAQ